MITSRVCRIRWRNLVSRSKKTHEKPSNTGNVDADVAIKRTKLLSDETQDMLKKMLPSLKSGDEPDLAMQSKIGQKIDDELSERKIDMDAIRARGFLKYHYNYSPPSDLYVRVKNVVEKLDLNVEKYDDIRNVDLTKDLHLKFRLLDLLANRLSHAVPNSELHRMRTVGDVIDFYSQPIANITQYARMARDEKNLPKNLHILEHPVRFHPEDVHAYHGGITAFPGEGGNVISLRNKRLYRQFKPKEEWFDYEDETFDYARPDKNMPWNPEIARRMDRYPTKKYNLKTKLFKKT